jgi:hypothetical protein
MVGHVVVADPFHCQKIMAILSQQLWIVKPSTFTNWQRITTAETH